LTLKQTLFTAADCKAISWQWHYVCNNTVYHFLPTRVKKYIELNKILSSHVGLLQCRPVYRLMTTTVTITGH